MRSTRTPLAPAVPVDEPRGGVAAASAAVGRKNGRFVSKIFMELSEIADG